MSRKGPVVARAVLIAFAVGIESIVTYLLVTTPPENVAAVMGSIGGIATLAAHVIASALLAAGFGGFLPGGSTSDRASVVALYFVVAFILPGAGIAGVAFLTAILRQGGKEAEVESPYIIGNPVVETSSYDEGSMPKLHLEPLGVSLRSLETSQVRCAVLALRRRAGRRDAAAILKRFRSDADSELQFFADSALAGAIDRAESRVAALSARVAQNPDDVSAHAGLAEDLIAAAADSGAADRKRLANAALGHLERARRLQPASWRYAMLTARAHLQAGDTRAAREVLGDEPQPSGQWLEILLRERRWGQLEELAESGCRVAPELRNALAFWGSDRGEERA